MNFSRGLAREHEDLCFLRAQLHPATRGNEIINGNVIAPSSRSGLSLPSPPRPAERAESRERRRESARAPHTRIRQSLMLLCASVGKNQATLSYESERKKGKERRGGHGGELARGKRALVVSAFVAARCLRALPSAAAAPRARDSRSNNERRSIGPQQWRIVAATRRMNIQDTSSRTSSRRPASRRNESDPRLFDGDFRPALSYHPS